VLGTLLVLFMLAQAGIPLTGGFIVSSRSGHRSGRVRAAGYGAVATVIAAWHLVAMSVASSPEVEHPVAEGIVHLRVDVGTCLVLAVCGGMTLALGVTPAVFVHWARDAALLGVQALSVLH
jgi:NADH:ubiquinone oxidoreductase subunit 2 (subunit N)